MSTFFAIPVLGFGFGPQEILIVAIVFMVLFGGAKLPGLMRNMGRSVNEFKAGMSDKPAPPTKQIETDEHEKEDQQEKLEV